MNFTPDILQMFLRIVFWGALMLILVGWLYHFAASLWRAKIDRNVQRWSQRRILPSTSPDCSAVKGKVRS